MSELNLNQPQGSEDTTAEDGGGPPEFNQEAEESLTPQEPSQPRNNGLLVLITLLLIGGVAVYFMRWKSGPASAVAGEEASTANETISQFLNQGEKNMKDMNELLKNTEKFVQQFKNDPSNTQVKLEELKTDPFRFSKAGPDNSVEEAARLAKEREKLKQAEKEAILKAVQQLQIQSILTSGKTRTCMINNVMYTEGQEVESFRVEKINPDGVILTRGGYRLQLKMNR